MNPELMKHLELEIEQKVTSLFNEFSPAYLIYHDLVHTQTVVRNTMDIASHYLLSHEDLFILFSAAWFHDTGQIFTIPAMHEEESVRIANAFFHQHPAVQEPLVLAIDKCIKATKLPQRPDSMIEKIICDADLFHFGTDTFRGLDQKVKSEASLRGADVTNWDAGTLHMLQQHKFHTTYCQEKLAAKKAENIADLIRDTNQ